MSLSIAYQKGNSSVSTSLTEVSDQFKKEVKNVIGSIILFFIVYLVLVVIAVALAVACVFMGIQVIIAFPKFITLVFGLGLMGLGLSLVFFLIKFVFAVNKTDNSNLVEIKEEDQPKLFALIRQLSADTQTKFPKKIFLSPDVNASVFYNSSFWSMFLPVRKNLVIGAGLVNCVNISEFKAVIAHEFGHFSQRSMKLGSFTYNVNKIIYNMLYENNGFNKMLNGWANLHGLISIFVSITIYIANAIIAILKKMYELINKSYMSLSRQMEFHADRIAASVAGANNLVTALRRIEVASASYNIALERVGEWLKKKEISTNIYRNQFSVLKAISNEHKLEVVNNLPVISSNFLNSLQNSRVNFEDQYASHPTRVDREVHLNSLGINMEPADESAWVIFENAAEVQKMMTDNLYKHIEQQGELKQFDEISFEQDYANETEEYRLPEEFCGFYSGRIITKFDVDAGLCKTPAAREEFTSIFNDTTCNLPKQLQNNQADVETVKAIGDKRIDVKTFDFDGKKYGRTEATDIVGLLEKEIDEQRQLILKKDEEAFCYFYSLANEAKGEELKEKYRKLFGLAEFVDEYFDIANNIVTTCNNFFQETVTIELATSSTATIKDNYEPKLKRLFREILQKNILTEKYAELETKVKKFLDSYYVYFHENSLHNEDIEELYSLTMQVGDALNNYRFKEYKKLLEFQLSLYKQAA